MRLFAYGTLQDPARLATVIGGGPIRVIGAGTIQGVLYDAGEYPALCAAAGATETVPGLLLELEDTALAALDRYEGVASGLYTRQRCAVALKDGETADAWVYVYARSVRGLPRIAAWPPPR